MPNHETPAERYRRLAEEALDVAKNFPPGEHRVLHMAQVWQRLAESYANSTMLNPPLSGADQPVMQQQEQVQPDPGDDKKK